MEPAHGGGAPSCGDGRRLPRWSKWILAGLCLATFACGVGNLPFTPTRSDALENLMMGVQLGRGGADRQAGYRREPLVPAVIAATAVAQRAFGSEPASFACADRYSGQVETLQCRAAYTPYRIWIVVFVLIAGVGAFFLTHWFTELRWLPHVAFLLVSQSLFGVWGFHRLLADIPAAAFLIAVSCLSVLTVIRRRVSDSAWLGLALAALTLTKSVFLPFALVVAAGLAVADRAKGTFGRRTALLVGVMLIAYLLPVGGWMTRNLVQFGAFAVVDADTTRVRQVIDRRAAYNTMRDDEFAAGFWYYTPYKPDLGIPKSSYERLKIGNIRGFHEFPQGTDNTLIETILADPWQHLKVSVLMAWRGVFVQHRLGIFRPGRLDLLRSIRLPDELSLPILDAIWRLAHQRWYGKEAFVVWFSERGTVDGYGESQLREFLDLETVAEFADITLYRVPPPEDFIARGPRISEVLNLGSPGAEAWVDSGGLRFALREAPVNSLIFTNNREALPSMSIDVAVLSEAWGFGSWPRLRLQLDAVEKTLVNLVGFIALLVAPLWYWRRYPDCIEILLVPLPALYLHAVYSVATHFLPRYAQPEIPLRIWAMLLLLCLVVDSGHWSGRVLLNWWVRHRKRQSSFESDSRAA